MSFWVQCTGGQRSNKGQSLFFGMVNAAEKLMLQTTDCNWNVKTIVHLSKFFYYLVSMLAKTINECENKCWFYNTEMPLALVSPHLLPETSCLYFFSQTFCIEV